MNRGSFHVGCFYRLAGTSIKAALIAACLLLFAIAAHAGNAPMTDKDVPVYPGAKPIEYTDPNVESMINSLGGQRRSSYYRVYKTSANPEEVFSFYRDKLTSLFLPNLRPLIRL